MDCLTYEELLAKVQKAEFDTAQLENEIKSIEAGNFVLSEADRSPELERLVAENNRLKYQIKHLKMNISEEENKKGFYVNAHGPSPDILKMLTESFTAALWKAFPDLPRVPAVVTPSTQKNFGDYQCNSAMNVAQILRKTNPKLKPLEVAQKICENVEPCTFIKQLSPANAGFINIFLKEEFISDLVSKVVKVGALPPKVEVKKRVVVDMSSPNIAKEMHVGHLRSTIIGESIARLYEYLGHDVLKLNHLGDWGTQFGMLIAHLTEKFPDYLTVSPPIGDLQAFYKESKLRFDSDEEFKKRAYAAVVNLQSYNDDHIKAWNLICNESRKEFTKIYDFFDINNLVDRGESFYQPLMADVVSELEEKKMVELDEGRKICWPPKATVPLTLVKSDGGMTYDTSDMAALKHRLFVEKADEILYVVDSGQAIHLNGVFAAGAKAGWFDPEKVRVEHVGFGVVLGEDKKKFKTRSGDTVRLIDLITEGLKRAEQKLIDKGRDKVLTEEELKLAEEAVAIGCIKYADLSHCRTNDYVFSFDKMLDDKGNTAVYLQYAYMRIRSIARQIGTTTADLRQAPPPTFEHPKEWNLAKLVIRFPEVIDRCANDLYLHNLCDYLYELATTFTEFYDNCYVVEKDKSTGEIVKVNMGRLVLCEATAEVMRQGFSILGIKTVERM